MIRKKTNTIKATKNQVRHLQTWLLETKQIKSSIENIPPFELNVLLSEYFIKLRKQNGEKYEPSSINNIQSSIERHLKDKDYPESITTSTIFNKTRQAIKAKKIEAKKCGLCSKQKASERIEPDEEQRLIESNQL